MMTSQSKGLLLKRVFSTVIAAAPLLFRSSNAQIRILQPPELATKFDYGIIRGSTAGFGTPYWGEEMTGVLVFGESGGDLYCSTQDYDLPATISISPGSSGNSTGGGASEGDSVAYPNIAVVRRGKCHFAQKVLIAQEKGASAVVVVDDEGSKRTAQDIRAVIMADDGLGSRVRIPSVLVADSDGAPLIEALRGHKQVIASLSWDMPNEAIVEIDQWMSPSISSSLNFLSSFAPFALKMKHLINYHPHFWIFSLPTDSSQMCKTLDGKFCALAPDWHDSGITGANMVDESLRQRCLWEMTSATNPSIAKSGTFSAAWWEYMSQVDTACLRPPRDSPNWAIRGSAKCSFDLMKTIIKDNSTPIETIENCVTNFGESYLLSDLYSHAWSSTALMINDARFAGPLDAFVVARAVCTGFTKEPEECQQLKATSIQDMISKGGIGGGPLNVLGTGGGVVGVGGSGYGAFFFLIVVVTLTVFALSVLVYRLWVIKRIRDELRYEVFEEVKSQMKLQRRGGPADPLASGYGNLENGGGNSSTSGGGGGRAARAFEVEPYRSASNP